MFTRRFLAAILVTASSLPIIVLAADAPAPPTPATAPANQAATRSVADILKDVQVTGADLHAVLPAVSQLMDDSKRKEIAPKAIPALQKMLGYLNELSLQGPKEAQEAKSTRYQVLSVLALLNDPKALVTLQTESNGSDPSATLNAKLTSHLVNYWKVTSDAAAQSKILDAVEVLAKENPKSNEIAEALDTMQRAGPASPKYVKRANDIVMNDLTGEAAKDLQTAPQSGKPFAFEGASLDGKKIASATFKGKVIVVDFWATWCHPCRAEIPHLAKLYKQYHDKGLEIISISVDEDTDDLKMFLNDHPEMTWPQISDFKLDIARQYNVHEFPTVYLVDRNGVLRSNNAREGLETLIPQLLDEKSKN